MSRKPSGTAKLKLLYVVIMFLLSMAGLWVSWRLVHHHYCKPNRTLVLLERYPVLEVLRPHIPSLYLRDASGYVQDTVDPYEKLENQTISPDTETPGQDEAIVNEEEPDDDPYSDDYHDPDANGDETDTDMESQTAEEEDELCDVVVVEEDCDDQKEENEDVNEGNKAPAPKPEIEETHDDEECSAGALCTPGNEKLDCDCVDASKFSEMYGIGIAVFGFLGYLFIFVLCFIALIRKQAKPDIFIKLTWLCVLLGFAYSVYLTGIEAFVLHCYCLYCVISALIMTAMFIVITAWSGTIGHIARLIKRKDS